MISGTTPSDLLEHYRPQLLSYALALLQHDSQRDVRASLRFTDVGVEESLEWTSGQMSEIESELRSMVGSVE
jgi:ATP-dependent helicase/nuclease subunit A